jgi:hypothetical protein
MKQFYRQDNIGHAKYTISFHNGIDKHKDGSDFFGIKIFKNKKKMFAFVDELQRNGYIPK